MFPDLEEVRSIGCIEEIAQRQGASLLIGLDEAGRGPLAGPVVAAAVCLDRSIPTGLNDSKKLTQKARESLFDHVVESSRAYGIASASPVEIDDLNILQASLLAMKRALAVCEEKLRKTGDLVLIDGNQTIHTPHKQWTIIKGDSLSWNIAAASILAKVTRDKLMVDFEKQYPGYGFSQHKGYPTKMHREAIAIHGPTEIHRKTFRGVKEYL